VLLHKYALCVREQGRLAESEALLRAALESDPGNAHVQFDLSEFELRHGDFLPGLARYERRAHIADLITGAGAVLQARYPRWNGEPLSGRTLVVWAEQGHGDCVWAWRFMAPLAERVQAQGGTLVFGYDGPMRGLFERTLPPGVRIESSLDTEPDCHCGLMSVPLHLGADPARPGLGKPYLRADMRLAALWRERVEAAAPRRRLRVGLTWNGNPDHARDARRSLDAQWADRLVATEAVDFFSLSPGRGATVAAWRARGMSVIDLTHEFASGFDDLAALMASLDLVVTIDSAPAHLAGALGRPAWLLLDHVSAWFWENSNERTRWYDSLTLVRQPAVGQWGPVVERVRQGLAAHVRAMSDWQP
jgi:hypothetical protein